jgi:hypothetical protein
MQRARTTLPDAAAELGTRQPNVITYHPEKGRLRVCIDRVQRSVDHQIERHTALLRLAEL